MGLFNRKADEASIIVVSLGGREDLLPNFNYPLGKSEQVLGRDEKCTIQLLDGLVSRRHVQINFDASRQVYMLKDLGSANGTHINGRPMEHDHELDEGDTIELGNTRLVFTWRKFKDHATAMAAFRRPGEHVKGTMIQ